MESIWTKLEKYYGEKDKKLSNILMEYALDWGIPITRRDGSFRLDNLKKSLDLINLPVLESKIGDHTKHKSYRSNVKRRNNAKTYNYWRQILIFHFLYDVPLEVFDLAKDKSELGKRVKKNRRRFYDVTRLKALGNSDSERKLKENLYLSKLISFLENIETSLFIYDYLERQYFTNNDQTYINSYEGLHKKLYSVIEDEIFKSENNTKRRYIRLLVLPIKNRFSTMSNLDINKEEVAKEVLEYCSPDLFEHICRCKVLKRKNSNVKVSFYMIAKPTRAYEYAILNNGSHCMTELYRYATDQTIKPDLLIIEEGKGVNKEVARLYREEIRKLNKSDLIFPVSSCKPILESLKKSYRSKLKRLRLKQEKSVGAKKSNVDYSEDVNDKKISVLEFKLENTEKKIKYFNHYFD